MKLFEEIDRITAILSKNVSSADFYREYDVVGISRLLKKPVAVLGGTYEEAEGLAMGKITLSMYIPNEMGIKSAENIFCDIFAVIKENSPSIKAIVMDKIKKDCGIPVINCSFSLWDTVNCTFSINGVSVNSAGLNITERNDISPVTAVGSENSFFAAVSKKIYEVEIIGADLGELDGLKQFTLTYEGKEYKNCVWKSISYDGSGFVKKAVFTAPVREECLQ